MPYDADQITNLDAELDALSSPSTVEVLAHTQDYDAGIVAASAARRALGAGGGGSQPGILAYTVTFEDVLAAPGVTAASATAAGGTSAITYTAAEEGISGNAIAVVSDVTPNTSALTISVDGSIITLHLETDGDGVVLSLFSLVRTALVADPAVTALIDVSDVTSGADPYDVGDTYLGGGESRLVLAELAEDGEVQDATPFIPEAWDATTTIQPMIGATVLFYDGTIDPEVVDDTGTEGLAFTEQTGLTFKRFRCTTAQELSVVFSSGAGAVPTQGEMRLFVDARTPS